MIKRENSFVEAMKFVTERNNKLVQQAEEKSNQKINEHNEFIKKYYDIKQKRIDDQKERVKIYESAQDQELATAIKGIFITALEAETLTDNGILLAEELVDKWIASEGGAAKIIRENKDKTYLLNRLCSIVEDAALKDLKSIYEADEEDDDELKSGDDDKEDKKKDPDYDIDDDEEYVEDELEQDDEEPEEEDDNTDSNGDLTYGVEGEKDVADVDDEEDDESEDEDELEKEVGSTEDEGESDVEEDSEDESEDEESDDVDTDESDMDEEPEEDEEDSEDEDLEDVDGDIDDDGEADIEDEPDRDDNEVLKDLDEEPDVQKAVALIRQRVSDAEETFIKNNAKDKEQINVLLGKISDNINTVENMANKDKEANKDAVAEEHVRMDRRTISQITNERPLSIMEMFARNLNKDIIRDESLKSHYVNENGSLDISSIVESAKILYGFLETLNTIQLGRKIDQNYLKEIF